MYTSTPSFPQPDTKLSKIKADQIIDEAQNLPTTYQPEVILLAFSGFKQQIAMQLDCSVIECNNLHDFLRNGLNQNSFVLVTQGGRPECNTLQLKELISSRTKHPFSIIVYEQRNEQVLIEKIKQEFRKVQNLISIEKIICEKAENVLKNVTCKSAQPLDGLDLTQRNEYKQNRKFLWGKVNELIEKKPEYFLETAINQIRNTPKK